jgi:hypothetical protein
MAKEEIKTEEVKVENKEQDNVEYSDDEILTPENKAILKKLIQTEGWDIVKKMVEELTKTAEEEITKQARAYSAVKSHGYTIYEIQGAWIDGLNKIPEILDAISHEDEVKQAVDEVNEAEAQQIKQ